MLFGHRQRDVEMGQRRLTPVGAVLLVVVVGLVVLVSVHPSTLAVLGLGLVLAIAVVAGMSALPSMAGRGVDRNGNRFDSDPEAEYERRRDRDL